VIALRGSGGFRRALENGARHSDSLLALRALRRPDQAGLDKVRVGVVVGKRFGGAVQRNRIRRWLRESARAVLCRSQGAWDLVLIPRDAARTVTHGQLRESLCRLVRRAGISRHDD
jgi:ribonuclease P protein component